ncbi:type VI secretion system-associated FHA domain protein [Xenorhabdus szentirmaii]|uniref:type VI secretion system-associated FHA domain protein n=1 Tax=Xenorhabdus szentirmaii TaxID=290112 RepID=UPI00198779DE|nr:type VI secretion system-associated FHA domain protein [Xenorhabdus sp. 38]MBD2779192.1 FHA domain-containing protein [Xenorhabdus sp. 38]
MMRFSIVKNTSTNQPPQLSYDFSSPGGTIGRSTDNNWVLPDEELAIARLQAIVSISAAGECWINNQGSASEVLLNMIPLAPGHQVEVLDGDTLGIGSYQIQVINISKKTAQQENTHQSDIPSGVWDDLEQMFTNTSNTNTNNTSTHITSAQNQHQPPPVLNDNHPLVNGQQDKERNPIDPLAHINPVTDLDTLQARSTDPLTMFNSDQTFQRENILHDHTPTTLLQSDNKQSNNKQSDKKYENQDDDKKENDPLILFSEKNMRHAGDNDPFEQMLNNAMPLNSLNHNTLHESLFTPELMHPDVLTSELSSCLTDSTDSTEEANNTLTEKPKINHYDPPHSHASHGHSSRDNQTNNIYSEEKLLAALLDGMRLKDIHRLKFDEQLMHQLGRFTSQIFEGIIVLNDLRIQFKQKVDVDMHQRQESLYNPFKLLTSGQSLLALMFGDPIPDFMPLEVATHDILTELKAHQLGMIAGIHAIVENILHSFHPVLLEQEAQDDGYLPRLSRSSAYKAAIWDYFTQHYQITISQFEQNSELFNQNFLQAYETEVSRYKNIQNKASK